MSLVEKFMGIAFTLIVLYLIIKNASSFNTVVNQLSLSTSSLVGQFQNGNNNG